MGSLETRPALVSKFTPEACYNKYIAWTKKKLPTGNPTFDNSEEVALMLRYTHLERAILDVCEPHEVSGDHGMPYCTHCGTTVPLLNLS